MIVAAIALVVAIALLAGCSESEALNAKQLLALQELLPGQTENARLEKMTIQPETLEKFPALKKAYQVNALEDVYYAFVVEPLGYRSAIQTLVLIDSKVNEVKGIRVLQHDETLGYAEFVTESWFLERFPGKKTDRYLKRAILEVEDDNEIIQITAATVTTQAVLNGINTAMGIYREAVLGEEAEPVELRVEGFVTELDPVLN